MSQTKIAVIGGTGLGQALADQTSGIRHEVETPFGKPSDAIIETEWNGIGVLFLSRHGAGHLINPSQIPVRANMFALKMLGATHILASGAVGSLRENMAPRDLTIPDQIIDKTYTRTNTFYEKAAVHVEFAHPFCPILRGVLLEASQKLQQPENEADRFSVHDAGCYVCMEGPAFSTRAESHMHRLWGGDLIGMTAMPEARLAREAELPYALVALVTDYDCWRNQPTTNESEGEQVPEIDPFALLNEIMHNLEVATKNAISLMREAVNLIAANPERIANCPAHSALQLGIWSNKGMIAPDEVQRLGPLWMKYFG